MVISINKVSKEVQEQVVDAYKSNMSLREIERQFGVSRQTTAKFLTQLGVKTTTGNHYRKYFHQEDFFENIDTEEKAYWLGFFFADGYIVNKVRGYGQDGCGITLAIEDEQHLQKFKTAIKATNPINYDDSKVGQKQCKIVLTSQKTVDDLISHGCVKQKSLILEPPIGIPPTLMTHFIRGYFDGDGSITKTHTPGKNFKTNEYCYGVNITCTYDMALWLQEYFSMGSIAKEHRREYTYYYTLGGRLQLIQFFHMLYDNASIWMDRKYNRFKEFC